MHRTYSLTTRVFACFRLAVLMAACMTTGSASAQELTRTGARKTLVVSAIERTQGAVVNIHSERPGQSPRPIAGQGTGIIIDPRLDCHQPSRN